MDWKFVGEEASAEWRHRAGHCDEGWKCFSNECNHILHNNALDTVTSPAAYFQAHNSHISQRNVGDCHKLYNADYGDLWFYVRNPGNFGHTERGYLLLILTTPFFQDHSKSGSKSDHRRDLWYRPPPSFRKSASLENFPSPHNNHWNAWRNSNIHFTN